MSYLALVSRLLVAGTCLFLGLGLLAVNEPEASANDGRRSLQAGNGCNVDCHLQSTAVKCKGGNCNKDPAKCKESSCKAVAVGKMEQCECHTKQKK